QSFGGGELHFFAPFCRDAVDVIFSVAPSGEDEVFTIRRPPMQVRRSLRGDWFGSTAFYRNGVVDGTAQCLHAAAQTQHFAVKREHMVIVVVFYLSGIEHFGLLLFQIESVDQSVVVINQAFAIRSPVGCLYGLRMCIDDLPLAGGYVQDLQAASQV